MSLGEIILLWMIGLIIFGACSIAIVRYVAACRRQRCDDQSAQESEGTKEPIRLVFNAEVTDQYCRVITVGTKIPKAVEEYVVCFAAQDGTLRKLRVSQEAYQALLPGQRGQLTLVDGQLYSFVLDDDTSVE